MIVIASRPGQLANMLFLFSHVGSFALSTGQKVVAPAFEPYVGFFPNLRGTCAIPPGQYHPLWSHYTISNTAARMLSRLSGGSLLWWKSIYLDWDEQFDLHRLQQYSRYKVIFLNGWRFRYPEGLLRHKDEIRTLFSPRENVMKRAKSLMKPNSINIGVHIRRGDYKTFMDGRFFYSVDVYKRMMMHLKNNEQRELHFVICTDDAISAEQLIDHNCTLSGGNAVEDLYTLSQCDYIMGPPSTFSLWASFYGDKPLLPLVNPDVSPALKDFSLPDY
ncbi:MAG: hypothetical protein Kow0075_11290 [Salibacteraceae bacterium]